MELQRRLRGVYMGAPHCKAVFGRKFSVPSKSGPEMAVFRELRYVNVKFLSSNPEMAQSFAKPRRLTYCA